MKLETLLTDYRQFMVRETSLSPGNDLLNPYKEVDYEFFVGYSFRNENKMTTSLTPNFQFFCIVRIVGCSRVRS